MIQLDCNACKSPASMVATKIARFSGVIQAIGVILLIPSFLGIAFAALVFLSTVMASSSTTYTSEAQQTGAAIGLGIGVMFSLFIGVISLVGGLLGWMLVLNRKVYKCVRCGFIIDRA